MKIAVGADHRGFAHKHFIINNLMKVGDKTIQWIDVGAFTAERSDYPEFAHLVVQQILEKKADYGVLLCGSGIGMAIAANRFKGIYAGLVWNEKVAKAAKEDDNSNVLVLPADFVDANQSIQVIKSWLGATFKDDLVYKKRLEMIDSF